MPGGGPAGGPAPRPYPRRRWGFRRRYYGGDGYYDDGYGYGYPRRRGGVVSLVVGLVIVVFILFVVFIAAVL